MKCAWALLLLLCPLLAQTPPTAPVEELLASSEPVSLAWGARFAAERGLAQHLPAILPLLLHDYPDVRLAAMDAAIRLNATVPLDLLRHFHSDPQAIVVLAARNPAHYTPLLMALARKGVTETAWVGIHSLFAVHTPPGFAALLLEGWTPTVTFSVQDSNYGSSGDGGKGYFDLPQKPAADSPFPPLIFHVLSSRPILGRGTEIIGGPHPVFSFTEPKPARHIRFVDQDAYRLDYLRYLTNAPAPQLYFPVQWQDSESCRVEIEGHLDALAAKIRTLRRSLRERGWLTAEEADIATQVHVRFEDRRQNKKVPLPSMPSTRTLPL